MRDTREAAVTGTPLQRVQATLEARPPTAARGAARRGPINAATAAQ
jgi:hypothetical protein